MLYWGGNPHSSKDVYIESCIHFWGHWTSLVVKYWEGSMIYQFCGVWWMKNMDLKNSVSLPLLLFMYWGVEPNEVIYHQKLEECGRLTFIIILPYPHYSCSYASILIIICVVPLQCHLEFAALFKILSHLKNLWKRFYL